MNNNRNNSKFEALNAFLGDRWFPIAKLKTGITDGKKDGQHSQPCPFCGGKDRFYVRVDQKTFHCRQCGFNGDIYDLCAKHYRCSLDDAWQIVASAAGFQWHKGGNNLPAGSGVSKTPAPSRTETENVTQAKPADKKSAVPQKKEKPPKADSDDNVDKKPAYRHVAATYYYCNEKYDVVHQVKRINVYNKDRVLIDKEYPQSHKNESGEWVSGEPAVLYPYHLDEILSPDRDVLYICEGEKAADCLRDDLIAAGCFTHSAVTTNSGGCKRANLWLDFVKRFPELLKKKIRILPDNDREGMKAARIIARAFLEAGATDVKIVKLPNIEDIPKADYVQCHELNEDSATDNPAVAAITYLQACCERTELCTLESLAADSGKADSLPPAADGETQPAETTAQPAKGKKEEKTATWDEMLKSGKTTAEIMETDYPQLVYVAEGMIPTGLTILGAQSKAGKSWLALQLALCVAAGLPFLGKFRTTQGNVLYLALEDTERRIKDRIKQLGIPAQTQCKMTQCKIMTQWADDFDALEYALQQKKYELVIIDTWGRFVSAVCKDGNDYAETTRLATCLHTLAKQYETCIIAITHTKKDATSADWLDNVIGSKGLVAVADTILSITRERHSDCGELKITGRDVSEEKLQIEHGDDWLWKLSENQDLTAAHQRILQELQQGEKTIRDLQQRLYQYKVSGGATAVESLLNELLHGNYVETYVSETTAKGGRPTAYWRLTAGSFE